jgi:hypothetical protein
VQKDDFEAALQEIGHSVNADNMKYYSKLGTKLRKRASREVERGEMYA